MPIIAVTRRRGKWQAEPAQSARCRDKPHRAVDKPPWVVYVYRAGNPDCLERGYDQPIDHLGGGADDASDLALALVVSVVLMLLVVLSRWLCRGGKATPLAAKSPRAKRDPKPFAGFTRKPDCRACEQDAESHPTALTPNAPPPRMTFTRGRHRHVETTGHFCSHATCAYHGWVGWGNLRANGHPNARRWRQLVCLSCKRHFLVTHGTPFHGKQVNPDKLVWAIAVLAEGLGIRAVARGFETDPTTVLGWLVEAADHLEAFSRHFLRDLDVERVQMDELFAWLSAVKDGEVSERQAI